jgi:hypothetical protein
MKYLVLIGALVVTTPALGQTKGTTRAAPPVAVTAGQLGTSAAQTSSNPWDSLPAVAPYRNLAEAIKESSGPGQPSPLNPTCEGMTGDACVRSGNRPER